MGIRIEKNDITKVENVDVIVNTANPYPVIGAGTDAAIYRAAGEEKLLNERLHKIGNIEPGEARISSGYDLCPYIVHTVGPKYIDGKHGEEQILRNCYRNSLKLARDNQCKHIAFPMISTGTYGYPKKEAVSIAVSEINDFLINYGNEMKVTIAVLSNETFFLLNKIIDNTEVIIDDDEAEKTRRSEYGYGNEPAVHQRRRMLLEEEERAVIRNNNQAVEFSDDTKTFSDMLFYYMNIRDEGPSTIYNRVDMDRRQFSKYCNNDRLPSKKDAIKICIGLRLTLRESVDLLSRADYAFNPSSPVDLEIIRGIKEHKSYKEIKKSLEEKKLEYFDSKKGKQYGN